jgi:hypothetical protein
MDKDHKKRRRNRRPTAAAPQPDLPGNGHGNYVLNLPHAGKRPAVWSLRQWSIPTACQAGLPRRGEPDCGRPWSWLHYWTLLPHRRYDTIACVGSASGRCQGGWSMDLRQLPLLLAQSRAGPPAAHQQSDHVGRPRLTARSLFGGSARGCRLRWGDPPRIPSSPRQVSASSAASGLPGRGTVAAPSPTSQDMSSTIDVFGLVHT